MQKFHINENGDFNKCKANSKECPYLNTYKDLSKLTGSMDNHYFTEEEARRASEKIHKFKNQTRINRKRVKNNSNIDSFIVDFDKRVANNPDKSIKNETIKSIEHLNSKNFNLILSNDINSLNFSPDDIQSDVLVIGELDVDMKYIEDRIRRGGNILSSL